MLSLFICKLCTHSPSSCLVHTLQAHVKFENCAFSQDFYFSMFCIIFIDFFFLYAYTLHTYFSVYSPNSPFCLHSASRCLVYTLQAYVCFQYFLIFIAFDFFILTFSPYVLVFTLQTDVWFTLSKHMLGFNFKTLTSDFVFNSFILHTNLVVIVHTIVLFTLSKQMFHFKILQS